MWKTGKWWKGSTRCFTSMGNLSSAEWASPYRKRGVNVIAIAMDAPQNTIAALSGKIGGLVGVSVKTAYSGVISKE